LHHTWHRNYSLLPHNKLILAAQSFESLSVEQKAAKMSSGGSSVKVVARFRPQNRIELDSGGQPIVRFEGNDTCSIDVRSSPPSRIYLQELLIANRTV
jgi:hypothetical protein